MLRDIQLVWLVQEKTWKCCNGLVCCLAKWQWELRSDIMGLAVCGGDGANSSGPLATSSGS